MEKLKVGILGATGMVGQRFVTLLAQHPWFSIEVLAASPKSAGKTYARSVEEKWMIAEPLPESVRDMVVADVSDVKAVASGVDFVFSAVDMKKDEIKAIEEEYAKAETPVVSNNSAHRWTGDVPMVIPEINADHYKIIDAQRRRLGTKRGFIAVKPNCSIQSYTPALAAWSEFEPYEVIVSTYQAISGAGKNFESWPEMTGNIIPFISGEEEKSEKEPMKVFGRISGNEIVPFEGMKIT
ncbi:MAG: aspartate-semialdehyde dehydrogenase, partial [Spirochaetales bacterium]